MRHFYKKEECQFIIDNYQNMTAKEIANILNVTEKAIFAQAFKLKLKKEVNPGAFKKGSEIGKEYRFQKGLVPHNKGRKMPPDQYEKCKLTMFKKGNKPSNSKHNGFLSLRKDKDLTKYVYIKIKDSVWEPLHRYLYEKHHGKIPKGYNVIFKDKNRLNFDINNLELVSNDELMLRNSYLNLPSNVLELVRTKMLLTRAINKALKEN